MTKISDFAQTSDNKFVCPYCQKAYSKHGIKGHIWRSHTKEGKNFVPNRTSWNKGQTKENNKSIKKASETLKQRYANGEITPSFQGKHHTEETKNKIGKSMKENNKAFLHHYDAKTYSKYEKRIADILDKMNIEYKHNYPQSYIYNNHYRRYQYDIAIIDFLIDIETDGWEHKLENRKTTDAIRDQLSRQYGWIVLRFNNEELDKMSDDEIFNTLNKVINDSKLDLPERKKLFQQNPYLIKKQEKTNKISFEEIKQKRIELINNLNVDVSEWGWSNKMSKIIGISSRAIVRFIKKNMPEFYEKCKVHQIKKEE